MSDAGRAVEIGNHCFQQPMFELPRFEPTIRRRSNFSVAAVLAFMDGLPSASESGTFMLSLKSRRSLSR
jgi:hypothetical protein